jgi:hypothetical protein
LFTFIEEQTLDAVLQVLLVDGWGALERPVEVQTIPDLRETILVSN